MRPITLRTMAVLALSTPAFSQLTFDELRYHHVPAPGHSALAIAAADIDGDGDLDVAVGGDAQSPFAYREIWLNDGTGIFTQGPALPAPPSDRPTESLAFADLDGDGDPDLIAGNQDSTSRLFENVGGAQFVDRTQAWGPVGAFHTAALATGDIDGDGDLDVVTANRHLDGTGALSRLYRNDGSGALTWDPAALPADGLARTVAMALGDLDGDQDLDLVLGRQTGTDGASVHNRLLLNDGTGIFTDVSATHLPADSDQTAAVALGDVDADGDLDLVTGNQIYWVGLLGFGTQDNRLYLNDGTGVMSLAPPGALPAGTDQTSQVALVDFDGDLDLDLFATSRVGNLQEQGINRLYLNDGSGQFTGTPLPKNHDDSRGLAIADFDGDLDLDILATNVGEPAELYLNDGGALFANASPWRMSRAAPWSPETTFVDFDGDGDLDVAQFDRNAPRPAFLLRNDGLGRLEHDLSLTVPAAAWRRPTWFDADGDGDLDAAFRTGGLWINDGAGNFADEGAVRIGAPLSSSDPAAAADIDGDGDLDLMFGPRLFENDGSGHFTDVTTERLTTLATSAIPHFGDVDADGDFDLYLAVDQVSSGLPSGQLFENNGLGVFTDVSSTRIPTPITRSGPAAFGDLDNDGDLDLVVTKTNLPFVERYLNDGTGTFAGGFGGVPATPVWSSFWTSIDLVDLDEDGFLDILLGERSSQAFLNDGAGAFLLGPGVVWPFGWRGNTGFGGPLAVGDVDGDGDPDVAAGAHLLHNLQRQALARTVPAIGRSYAFEFQTNPAFASPQVVVPLTNTTRAAVPVPIPPLGSLGLGLTGLLAWPALVIDATGRAAIETDLPVMPTWVGQSVYMQGLVLYGANPADWRLTNVLETTIRG